MAERGTTTQKVARRARIVLMLAQQNGRGPFNDGAVVGAPVCGRPGVLRDATRPGRRPRLTLQAIVDATLTTRPPAGTHWSSRALAEAQRVSDGTIRKIWRVQSTDPHSSRMLRVVRGGCI